MAGPSKSPLSAPRKWVLIVDDEADIREQIRTFIELNYRDAVQIVEASDGVEATSRIHFKAFDVILTDLRMPRKEGVALIKSIRESPFNSKTPIIVLTGKATEGLGGDFVQVIHKPSSLSEISTAVANQLRLGTENRVSADILNCFVESTELFYKVVLKMASQVLKPEAKMRGANFNGAYVAVASIKSGTTTNDFVLGFAQDVLAKSLPKDIPMGRESIEKAARAAMQVIVKKVVTQMGTSRAHAVNTHVYEASAPEIKPLNQHAGIVIPVTSAAGTTHIYVVWESKGH